MPCHVRLGAALGFLGLLACGGSERDEARRFLAGYALLNHRDPADKRELSVGALEQLPLRVPRVVEARDACVKAHRALLTAEQAQEAATVAVDTALAEVPAGGNLEQSALASAQARIAHAETALSSARSRFAVCQSAAQSLALRFAPR